MIGLNDRQSSGGAVARSGFEYQDTYALQNLPAWLAQDAFSHLVSESLGDIEVRYFNAKGKTVCRFIEAKETTLSETQFWDEIDRFYKVHSQSPDECASFVLVCQNYNGNTSPLVNKVERLRGVGSAWNADSTVIENTKRDIVTWVLGRQKPQDLADFIINYVAFETFDRGNVEQAFGGNLAAHLPVLESLNHSQTAAIREKFKAAIQASTKGPIKRILFEDAIADVLGAVSIWMNHASQVCLSEIAADISNLHIDVRQFNSPARKDRDDANWKSLAARLDEIRLFLKESRTRRLIRLDGKQRMSLSCLLGFVFGATRGFTLAIEHNRLTFRTDDHSKAETPFFSSRVGNQESTSQEAVVSLGFPVALKPDVLGKFSVLPILFLDSTTAIDGIASLNTAIAEAKSMITQFKTARNYTKLHLFIRAPSFFSMAMGHRLNSLGCVQLYDWVEGQYIPAIELIT